MKLSRIGSFLLALILGATACQSAPSNEKTTGAEITETSITETMSIEAPTEPPETRPGSYEDARPIRMEGFGDRIYLLPSSCNYASINQYGAYECINNQLYFAPIYGLQVLCCTKEACRHIRGKSPDCEAELPHGPGSVIEDEGYLYVLSRTGSDAVGQPGIWVSRRKSEGGSWEDVGFVAGCYIVDETMRSYQFAEDHKAYLIVALDTRIDLSVGTYINARMGVMELDYTNASYRMLVPFQERLYTNARYLNKEGDILTYCYTSTPPDVVEVIRDLPLKKIGDELTKCCGAQVITVDCRNNREVLVEEYKVPGSEIACDRTLIRCNKFGVFWSDEEARLYLRKPRTAEDISLFQYKREDSFTATMKEQTCFLMVKPDLEVVGAYLISQDGSVQKPEKYERPMTQNGKNLIYVIYALENGYSICGFENEVRNWWNRSALMSDEMLLETILPEEDVLLGF